MAIRPAGARISEFFGDKPDYSALGNQATADAAKGEVNTAMNNARTSATVMKAVADEQAAEHWADVTRAGGAAASQTAAVSGIASAVGGLGGLFSGGGAGASVNSEGYQIGKADDGSYGGFGGKYGSFEDPTADINAAGISKFGMY